MDIPEEERAQNTKPERSNNLIPGSARHIKAAFKGNNFALYGSAKWKRKVLGQNVVWTAPYSFGLLCTVHFSGIRFIISRSSHSAREIRPFIAEGARQKHFGAAKTAKWQPETSK